MIKIIKNEELIPHIFEYDVVLFPMGINNSLNRGLANEIGINCHPVFESENRTGFCDQRKYGKIHNTEYNGTIFCACYCHTGGFFKYEDGSFINYDYLKSCLEKVQEQHKKKKIATKIMGCSPSDGNGNKEKIIKIYEETFTDTDITIYDYIEEEYSLRIFREIAELHKKRKDKEITKEEYLEKRKEVEWRKKNGIFIPMSDDYDYKPKTNRQKFK